jgi:hypothetical protein
MYLQMLPLSPIIRTLPYLKRKKQMLLLSTVMRILLYLWRKRLVMVKVNKNL